MNNKHQLEWAYQPGYDIMKQPCVTLNSGELTFEDFMAKMPKKTFEIQRVEATMEDGVVKWVQSKTKNTISFSPRYVVISEAQRLESPGVVVYRKYTLRRKHVKEVRIWYDLPPLVKLNHEPEPEENTMPEL